MKEILIVVDMQNDFITGSLGSADALAIVPAVVQEIKSGRYAKIIATADTHHADYLSTLEGRKLPVPHCLEFSQGWMLHEEIEKALNGKEATICRKPTFGDIRLCEDLRALVRQNPAEDYSFTLVGVCTDICVVSNAVMLRAYLPDNEIRVLSGACAGTTPQAHAAALQTMQSCQIDVV